MIDKALQKYVKTRLYDGSCLRICLVQSADGDGQEHRVPKGAVLSGAKRGVRKNAHFCRAILFAQRVFEGKKFAND